MLRDQIIIFTEYNDPHADELVHKLVTLGHEPIRLNTEDFPQNIAMALQFDTQQWQGHITVTSNRQVIDPQRVCSVWMRRPGQYIFPSDVSKIEQAFGREEIHHALRGFWATLDCYWMSHPDNIQQASKKGEQLQRAAQIGFDVPRTLITSDPQSVRTFYEECHGQIVFKVMSGHLGVLAMSREHPDEEIPSLIIPTTLVRNEQLEFLDTIQLAPCLFQEYIPKQLEFRVTIIGDEIFVAEIHSQDHPATQIDCRNFDVDILYRKATLPDDITERCFSFVKSYGLTYSALDLVLTPDGRYVFLENNPVGQFLFVEQLVPDLAMSDALAACLIRGSS